MVISDKLFQESSDLFLIDKSNVSFKAQQSTHDLLRAQVIFHKSETLNVELVFGVKITDAWTELSSLEIILLTPDNT